MNFNHPSLFIFGYTLKTKYRNLVIFSILFPFLLAIENPQNHFIFNFHFFEFRQLKKALTLPYPTPNLLFRRDMPIMATRNLMIPPLESYHSGTLG
jgi:hypothetical protein